MIILGKIKAQKLISFFIIVSMLSPLLPAKHASAQIPVTDALNASLTGVLISLTGTGTASTVTNTAFNIKKFLSDILKEVLKTIAKRALAELSKSTVNWINSGFHGKPLFLESPDSFFKDITKFEIKRLVDTLGYNSSLYPYGRNWSLGIIGAYKRQIDYNAAYSLSLLNLNEAIDQANFETFLQNYRSNFNIGGWNGLTLHTQYPQNNAFGFQMRATEELARRINTDPNANNEIGKTKSLLQQGQGFLSPQVCRSNPDLVQNPYNPPTFKFDPTLAGPFPDRAAFDDEDKFQDAYNGYLLHRQATEDGARIAWENQNTCKGGWANTTPGYVAASQITRALGSKFSQNELGQALGTSLSAIFHALLNKLFDTGLNALASKVNPPPETPDNWDYLGNTLGSPDDNPNRDIFSGPDQEVVLGEFKKQVNGQTLLPNNGNETSVPGNTAKGTYKAPGEPIDPDNPRINGEYIPGDIALTQKELALMDNSNGDPGLTQILSWTWPKIRELDICLPGPNYGWETRLDEEMNRNSQKLQGKTNDSNGERAYEASLAYKNLKYAVNFFKDWIKTKMMTTLPSGIIFMDAVKEVEDLDQKWLELNNARRRKAEALARLKAIGDALGEFSEQPSPGSQQEKDLIIVKKQYDSLRISISNAFSIEDTNTELDVAKDKLDNLNQLINRCAAERRKKGWNILPEWDDPGGEKSILSSEAGKPYTAEMYVQAGIASGYRTRTFPTTGQEKEQFCTLPIVGGYTHDSFINRAQNPPAYPAIPMINARDVFNYSSGFLGLGTTRINIQISCDTVYQSNILDYKGDLPGGPEIKEPPPPPTERGYENTGTPPPGSEPPPPENCGGAGQIACL